MGICQGKPNDATSGGYAFQDRNDARSGNFSPPPGNEPTKKAQAQAAAPAPAAAAKTKAEADDDTDRPTAVSGHSRHQVTPSIRENLINLHANAAAHQQLDSVAEEQKNGERRSAAKSDRVEGAQRLRNIFAAPIEMVAGWVAPVNPKTPAQHAFIDDALSGNFIFSNLNDAERKTLIDAMELHSVAKGTVIIKQGDIGDFFYIIQNGKVTFHVDGRNVGKAKEGGSFGELALLYNCPRAATCVAEVPCDLWRVDQNTFRKILASHQIQNDNETRDVVRKVPFLADLDDKYINKIVDALTTVTFTNGELIVRKGDPGNVFYVLKEGSAKISDIEVGESKYEDQELTKGDFFGERAIITDEPRAANVTATSDGTALCLSREQFIKILGPLKDIVIKSQDKRRLMGVPAIAKSNLEPFELDTLASIIDDVNYPKNFIFAEEGRAVDGGLYFVRSGKVSLNSSDGKINILTKGGYFGEDTLVQKKGDGSAAKIARHTVKAEEDCTLGVLTLVAIESVIEDLGRLGKESDNLTRSKLDTSINFEDLKKYRILGVGTFGQVWLVSQGGTKNAYALKIQNKRELMGHHQVDGVIREKNVMASIDHPFIIKLVNTYQDERNLFMLVKLVQGGELFSVLHTDDRDGVKESSAQFYAAGILEGLSYMHHRHILYRDLKPENVLMDAEGYTVIVDLGFAKIVMDKTYTLCGTPLYLAPEVILSRGHDKGADHWSLGVLIYEMIVGITPFYDHNIDQITLFKRIVHGKMSIPSMVGSSCSDLVKRMLVTRPNQRLGSFARGDKDIREHPWLSSIDFEKLVRKEIPAPWVPKIKDPLDVSNFDNWDHLEKEADKKDKTPLTAREQEMFKAF